MRIFATEFKHKSLSKAAFVSEVTSWIAGMEKATVLQAKAPSDLDSEMPTITGPGGDRLALLEVVDPGSTVHAIGFRYDNPDKNLLWRTEGVLTTPKNASEGTFRIRVQCLAASGLEVLHTPNKPYLIKNLIAAGRISPDGAFSVSDKVHVLSHDDFGLDLAKSITEGSATTFLPVVYVSARSGEACALTDKELGRLAFNLGGVAHVVREPDRAFSFELQQRTQGQNIYGGSIGISVPQRGFVRRAFLGWEVQTSRDLADKVEAMAGMLRSQMATSNGWDWSELQETKTRTLRLSERGRLSAQESEQLWQDELEAKDDIIRELREQLTSFRETATLPGGEGILDDDFQRAVGPEIYEGEFSDRILMALRQVLDRADTEGLDTRSQAVLQAILDKTEPSGRAAALSAELGRAVRDRTHMQRELRSILQRHGYVDKSNNKHARMEPRDGFVGLQSITIMNTPSDMRGQKNLKSQIEATLGITRLKGSD